MSNQGRNLSLIDEIYFGFDDDRTVSAIGIDRVSGLTNNMIQQAMRRAIDQNEVLMLYGHYPATISENNSYSFDIKLFEFILMEAKKII